VGEEGICLDRDWLEGDLRRCLEVDFTIEGEFVIRLLSGSKVE
jgi:hypothetical protein